MRLAENYALLFLKDKKMLSKSFIIFSTRFILESHLTFCTKKRTSCKIHKFHKLNVEVIKCMDSKFVKACKTYATDITFGRKRILKERGLFKARK